ncbi:uncharacterized protein At2g39910 isoform X1 [Daucus carota subsp. sativus]|uniref:uncharacterized protein At2g39910 isoform X1 n=1 Tax=Daucus carota subsp. sativus TaxID=79200 RepID=UPI0007EF5BE0|nr:PREDICTED: uncharacterized protein At2g39910 isoform X1 [Daucus carota subsp. sativus]
MAQEDLRRTLLLLCDKLGESISKTKYKPPEGSNVSIKSALEILLPRNDNVSDTSKTLICEIRNFSLLCAALASSQVSTSEHLLWIPNSLAIASISAFQELAKGFCSTCNAESLRNVSGLGLDLSLLSDEQKLVVELMPQVMPLLKDKVNESSVDKSDDADEITAASARAPVAYAIVASYQLRWFVTQVEYPSLGKLCALVIPCCLTALDHWSPEVKGQGMISFIHLAKNVNAAEFGLYEDVILDACCQNVASTDEIWDNVVEMSVLLVTCLQRNNPRSSWYEKLLNEMLSHLERQPRNRERRISWLKHIDPLFNSVGLVLLAHFRRIFPLFFKWMHADDDETVLLVLDRITLVIKLTWIRNSPHFERLVDELISLYKEAALKIEREAIRTRVLQILILLHQCKGPQFEGVWNKHKDDPNLTALSSSFNENCSTLVQV